MSPWLWWSGGSKRQDGRDEDERRAESSVGRFKLGGREVRVR